MNIRAEAVFFDVGQGTANTILTEDGHALIFDAGPGPVNALHQFLEDYLTGLIKLVVLSHNDKDHIGGWEVLAERFGDRIESLYVLKDRDIKRGDTIDLTISLAEQGIIPEPKRAEVRNLTKPEVIWEDSSRSLSVCLLYPDMIGNISAERVEKPNRTSAIATVTCSGRRILYPGDSTHDAWERIDSTGLKSPLEVEIVAMPHHGGLLGRGRQIGRKQVRGNGFEWMFSHAVRCRLAVVSVGTSNPYGHPRQDVLEALTTNRVRIMCTEITSRCHEEGALSKLVPGVIHPGPYSRSSTTTNENGSCVGCAGTIIAFLGDDGIVVDREAEHWDSLLRRTKSPLCKLAPEP